MRTRTIVELYRLLAPRGFDPRAEGEENTFTPTLPEDLRANPSLQKFKDPGSLAKSYVELEKLVGQKRIVAPQENWNETQWNEFYNQTGRPETVDKYEFPKKDMEPGIMLDEKKANDLKAHFHKLGLSKKQAAGVVDYYLDQMNTGAKEIRTTNEASSATAIATLKGEWGDKFDANVDLAKGAIRKFGDASMTQFLESSGLGNNVPLVKMLAKIGQAVSEDVAHGGGSEMLLKGETRAVQEIEALKTDEKFMKTLLKPGPGHKEAVERWARLHSQAFPGTQTE